MSALPLPGSWLVWGAVALTVLLLLGRPGNVVARALLRPLVRLVYDLRVIGGEHVPPRGGALLVANHVSYADAFLLGAALQRPVRYLMHRSFFERSRLVGALARWVGAIPVASGDTAQERERALSAAAESLRSGDLVGIFAEGRITRTGSLLGFRRGLESIALSSLAPIVPVALDEVWGSIFSFAGGRALAHLPRRLPYRVGLSFGAPLPYDTPSHRVRDELQTLLAVSAERRATRLRDLGGDFLEAARRRAKRTALVDERGQCWTYAQLAGQATALALVLRETLGPAPRVGVELDHARAAVLAHLALALLGRAVVPLVPQAESGEREEFLRAAGADTLLATSNARQVAGVRCLDMEAELLRLPEQPRTFSARQWGARHPAPAADAELAVLHTRPPSGPRRAVVLAHRSVAANVRALVQIAEIAQSDVVLAALPPTQTYGVTVCLWTPLLSGAVLVLPPAEGNAQTLAERVRTWQVTGLVGTPAMYRAWLENFSRADVAAVRLAISGGAHLDDDVAARWRDELGCSLHEGYGVSEMGPVVAVNLPDVRRGGVTQENRREGTVGRALPGTAVRVERPDGALADADEIGRIRVRGPGRMLGHLHDESRPQPGDPSAWIDTGDLGALDRDGFLRVTGRA